MECHKLCLSSFSNCSAKGSDVNSTFLLAEQPDGAHCTPGEINSSSPIKHKPFGIMVCFWEIYSMGLLNSCMFYRQKL